MCKLFLRLNLRLASALNKLHQNLSESVAFIPVSYSDLVKNVGET